MSSIWNRHLTPRRLRTAFAALLGLALAVGLFGTTHAWFHGGRYLSPDTLLLLLYWVPLLFLIRAWRRGCQPPFARSAPGDTDPVVPVLFALLVLFLVSQAPRHPWFYIHRWPPSPGRPFHHSWSVIERFVLLTAVLTPLLLPGRRLGGGLLLLLLGAQAVAFSNLLHVTDCLPLYRDDHPSFLFRLHEFVQSFPARKVYNPAWNGGGVAWSGTSSGVVGVGLALWPAWRLLPVHEAYTPAFGVLFLLIAPLLCVFAVRALRAGWTAALAGGLIGLAVSRYFLVWAHQFGTIGSCFAMSFLPLAAALTYRILVLRRDGLWTLAAWTVSVFFLLQWPPTFLMAAALVPGALWNVRRWRRRTLLRLAAAAAVVLVLDLPALLAIAGGHEVTGYVLRGADGGQGPSLRNLPPAAQWFDTLAHTTGTRLLETHPLVVFWGLAGLCVLPWRRLRRWLLPPVALLLLLAAWGPIVLPRMQLERMAIPATLLALLPAALWTGRILRGRAPARAPVRAATLALLLLGAWSVTEIYKAKGYAPYTRMPGSIVRLTEWVRANVPEDGRLLFAGPAGHSYGGGHVAYLPVLCGREMMAADYFAFPPGMVDAGYPPAPFRDSLEGVLRFASLFDVTHVIACRDTYADLLRGLPPAFRELPDLRAEGFFLFEVLQPRGGRCALGRAVVQPAINRFDLSALSGDPVVLRYNWADGLRATPPAVAFPYDAGDGIRLVGVHPNGAPSTTIRFRAGEGRKTSPAP